MGARAGLFPAWTEADWRNAAEAALKGAPVDRLVSKSADGIRIEPLYGPADGPRPLGREGAWAVVARVDHPYASEANTQALEDLAGGADALQIIFAGAVGAYGFGLGRSDSATLHTAFDGIRFDAGQTFELDLGPDGPAEALAFAALIERSGAKPSACTVSFGLDPFARLASGPFPAGWAAASAPFLEAGLALRAKGFAGPLFIADARVVHAAGGTPGQELAFGVGAGLSLLRSLSGAGVGLDEARRLIGFRLASDADEFLTLAKFRAIRLLWGRVEQASGLSPRKTQVQAESAWRMMTVRDPYVNVMRSMLAAFSAGLGGADSVSALPPTLAIGFPDSLARRLARNGQLILLRESNLGFVADPAAGAGAFESLTKELCEKAWSLFQADEASGGLSAVLASGALQREVAKSATALRGDAARLKSPITGVSAHPNPSERCSASRRERQCGILSPGRGGRHASDPARRAVRRLRDRSARSWLRLAPGRESISRRLGHCPAHRRRIGFMTEWLEAGGFAPVYDGEAAAPKRRQSLSRQRRRSCVPLRRRRRLCDVRLAFRRRAQGRGSRNRDRWREGRQTQKPICAGAELMISCSRARTRSRGWRAFMAARVKCEGRRL